MLSTDTNALYYISLYQLNPVADAVKFMLKSTVEIN